MNSSFSNQASAATDTNWSASTTPPPTTSVQTPNSTSTIIEPPATFLRDWTSSKNTIYAVRIGSTSQQYRNLYSVSFASTKADSEYFINPITASLDNFVGLCAQWNVNDDVSSSGLAQMCGAVCWRNRFVLDTLRSKRLAMPTTPIPENLI